MHYRHNEFQNFLQNLALDAHGGLHRKSTLAFIRHCSRVGGGGNDKLAIDKGGNLPEKVENHWPRSCVPVKDEQNKSDSCRDLFKGTQFIPESYLPSLATSSENTSMGSGSLH